MKEGKYLITTDNYFYAPNGKQYRAVWGKVSVLSDEILGVKTNRNSTNWFAKIGNESNHVIIAGCQIHYAVRCENKPNTRTTVENHFHNAGISSYKKESEIYIAE